MTTYLFPPLEDLDPETRARVEAIAAEVREKVRQIYKDHPPITEERKRELTARYGPSTQERNEARSRMAQRRRQWQEEQAKSGEPGEIKHLPGRHPQATHGHGHGGEDNIGQGMIPHSSHLGLFGEDAQNEILDYQENMNVDFEECVGRGRDLMEAAKARGATSYQVDQEWYNRARNTAQAAAKRYGVSFEQASAVIAVMSPRNKWDQLFEPGKRKLKPEEVAEREAKRERRQRLADLPGNELVGTSGNIIRKPNLSDAAFLMRVHQLDPEIEVTQDIADRYANHEDETHLAQMVGTKQKLSQYTPEQAAYLLMPHINGTGPNAIKAIKMLRGDDIDATLKGPKVRAFYNNIHSPHEPGSVTVDTWMVHALTEGRGHPYRLSEQEVQNLLYEPQRKGLKGIGSYPFYADIISVIAKEYHLSPHEAQAVIWEEYRRDQEASTQGGKKKKKGFPLFPWEEEWYDE